ALDLLARHIVDQRASNLLFGDRRRLQEDLLADAASAEVRKLFPKVPGCPVALTGAQNETLSVAEACLSYPNCSPRGING
ncbi:MAG: hypothetical protein WCB20_03085, partial [Chthoniobacterales bacterium]